MPGLIKRPHCRGCHVRLVEIADVRRGRCAPCEARRHLHPWKKDNTNR